MTEEMRVEGRRRQVIGMVTETRALLEELAGKAREIRSRDDLEPARKQQALDEVIQAARTPSAHVIRDARRLVLSGGAANPVLGLRKWHEYISEEGRAARAGILAYIDAAERVFEVLLEELSTGKVPRSRATEAAEREVAAYEAAHLRLAAGRGDLGQGSVVYPAE